MAFALQPHIHFGETMDILPGTPPPLFSGRICFTRRFEPKLADEHFRRGAEIEQGLIKASAPDLENGKSYVLFATALDNDMYQVSLYAVPHTRPPVSVFLQTSTGASAYLLWQERADLTDELIWAAEEFV